MFAEGVLGPCLSTGWLLAIIEFISLFFACPPPQAAGTRKTEGPVARIFFPT
jgi:hypothetical protein